MNTLTLILGQLFYGTPLNFVVRAIDSFLRDFEDALGGFIDDIVSQQWTTNYIERINPYFASGANDIWVDVLEVSLAVFPIFIIIGLLSMPFADEQKTSLWRQGLRIIGVIVLIALSRPLIGFGVELTNFMAATLYPESGVWSYVGMPEYENEDMADGLATILMFVIYFILSPFIAACVLITMIIFEILNFILWFVYGMAPALAVMWYVDWGILESVNEYAEKLSRMAIYAMLTGPVMAVVFRVFVALMQGDYITAADGVAEEIGAFFSTLIIIILIPFMMVTIPWKLVSQASEPLGAGKAITGALMAAFTAATAGAGAAAGAAGGAKAAFAEGMQGAAKAGKGMSGKMNPGGGGGVGTSSSNSGTGGGSQPSGGPNVEAAAAGPDTTVAQESGGETVPGGESGGGTSSGGGAGGEPDEGSTSSYFDDIKSKFSGETDWSQRNNTVMKKAGAAYYNAKEGLKDEAGSFASVIDREEAQRHEEKAEEIKSNKEQLTNSIDRSNTGPNSPNGTVNMDEAADSGGIKFEPEEGQEEVAIDKNDNVRYKASENVADEHTDEDGYVTDNLNWAKERLDDDIEHHEKKAQQHRERQEQIEEGVSNHMEKAGATSKQVGNAAGKATGVFAKSMYEGMRATVGSHTPYIMEGGDRRKQAGAGTGAGAGGEGQAEKGQGEEEMSRTPESAVTHDQAEEYSYLLDQTGERVDMAEEAIVDEKDEPTPDGVAQHADLRSTETGEVMGQLQVHKDSPVRVEDGEEFRLNNAQVGNDHDDNAVFVADENTEKFGDDEIRLDEVDQEGMKEESVTLSSGQSVREAPNTPNDYEGSWLIEDDNGNQQLYLTNSEEKEERLSELAGGEIPEDESLEASVMEEHGYGGNVTESMEGPESHNVLVGDADIPEEPEPEPEGAEGEADAAEENPNYASGSLGDRVDWDEVMGDDEFRTDLGDDPMDVLDLEGTPTQSEVSSAAKEKSAKYHPDISDGDTEDEFKDIQMAADKMQEVAPKSRTGEVDRDTSPPSASEDPNIDQRFSMVYDEDQGMMYQEKPGGGADVETLVGVSDEVGEQLEDGQQLDPEKIETQETDKPGHRAEVTGVPTKEHPLTGEERASTIDTAADLETVDENEKMEYDAQRKALVQENELDDDAVVAVSPNKMDELEHGESYDPESIEAIDSRQDTGSEDAWFVGQQTTSEPTSPGGTAETSVEEDTGGTTEPSVGEDTEGTAETSVGEDTGGINSKDISELEGSEKVEMGSEGGEGTPITGQPEEGESPEPSSSTEQEQEGDIPEYDHQKASDLDYVDENEELVYHEPTETLTQGENPWSEDSLSIEAGWFGRALEDGQSFDPENVEVKRHNDPQVTHDGTVAGIGSTDVGDIEEAANKKWKAENSIWNHIKSQVKEDYEPGDEIEYPEITGVEEQSQEDNAETSNIFNDVDSQTPDSTNINAGESEEVKNTTTTEEEEESSESSNKNIIERTFEGFEDWGEEASSSSSSDSNGIMSKMVDSLDESESGIIHEDDRAQPEFQLDSQPEPERENHPGSGDPDETMPENLTEGERTAKKLDQTTLDDAVEASDEPHTVRQDASIRDLDHGREQQSFDHSRAVEGVVERDEKGSHKLVDPETSAELNTDQIKDEDDVLTDGTEQFKEGVETGDRVRLEGVQVNEDQESIDVDEGSRLSITEKHGDSDTDDDSPDGPSGDAKDIEYRDKETGSEYDEETWGMNEADVPQHPRLEGEKLEGKEAEMVEEYIENGEDGDVNREQLEEKGINVDAVEEARRQEENKGENPDSVQSEGPNGSQGAGPSRGGRAAEGPETEEFTTEELMNEEFEENQHDAGRVDIKDDAFIVEESTRKIDGVYEDTKELRKLDDEGSEKRIPLTRMGPLAGPDDDNESQEKPLVHEQRETEDGDTEWVSTERDLEEGDVVTNLQNWRGKRTAEGSTPEYSETHSGEEEEVTELQPDKHSEVHVIGKGDGKTGTAEIEDKPADRENEDVTNIEASPEKRKDNVETESKNSNNSGSESSQEASSESSGPEVHEVEPESAEGNHPPQAPPQETREVHEVEPESAEGDHPPQRPPQETRETREAPEPPEPQDIGAGPEARMDSPESTDESDPSGSHVEHTGGGIDTIDIEDVEEVEIEDEENEEDEEDGSDSGK